ncbi:hypothetical protein CL621_03430 [archaeon]|nr:hypothetical protein [archaeon]
MEINLEKQAKISINPKAYGPRTESKFKFKIGIEKRAIKLSPEKTQDMIDNLDEQLDKWASINEKLGKVVKGLKTACFATSAMFTVKNLFAGFSGESMARNAVMTGPNGWNDKCKSKVEGKEFASMQECMLNNSPEIQQSVDDYKTMLERVNGKMEDIQGLDGAKRDSSDFLDFEGSVDSNFVKQKFCEEHFKGSGGVFQSDKFINLSDGQQVKMGDIFSEEKIKNCDVSLSNMRDLYALGQLDEGTVAYDVMRTELSRDLLYTYEVNQQDVNYDVLKKEASPWVGEQVQALSLSGDKVAYSPMNHFTKAQADKFNDAAGLEGKEKIGSGTRNIIYKVSLGADVPFTKEGGEKPVNLLKEEGLTGKTVMLVLEKEGSGNKYGIKNAYEIIDKDNLNLIKRNSSLFGYLDKRGANKFIEANPKAYQNKIANPSSLKVKYFQREPYKGLPAEVPFDVENGWYVEMTYVLSGFGKPYEESGRATNYYICNVGPNGRIEFKQSRDDICRYYNGNTADLNFPGMSLTDSKRLISRAQDAVAQASKQSGKDRVVINGQSYGGGIAIDGNEGQCTDFMSPGDCNLLFNICDPVICPSSRCDLGGKYRVDNVVQSGIIGSLTLCLPNMAEGIMIPICLSGVHAGIEGYVSILNSTKACLKESLDTGRNIGICDEIKSIYLCEFFWKQAAPFVNVILPRLFESMYSQGARGGGEYLTVQGAWDNMQDSIDYFKNSYAVNSMSAFSARSTEEIGSDICKSFMSVNAPKNFFDTLTEPDSPEQYHAWFSEDELTSATIPPTSHYKVYYHIFAGNDQGASYVVYLKDLPESNYIHSAGSHVVDRGYIASGGSVDRAKDFSAVSGYKQLCISINGQDKCGFGKVSTSYFVNKLSDEYAKEQSSQLDIKKEKDCIAGTRSVLSLAQPNLQEGVDDLINPELYNSGIIRVCSTYNPGKQVDLTGEYDTTNSTYSRWKQVGYCDDPKIKCWLDSSSVKDVIQNTGIEEQVLEDVDMSIFGEGYWDKNESDTKASKVQEFIDETLRKDEELKTDTGETIDGKIASNVEILTKLTNLGVTNRYRARGFYLLGTLYNVVASKISIVEVKKDDTPPKKPEVSTSTATDVTENGLITTPNFEKSFLLEMESTGLNQDVYLTYNNGLFGDYWKWSLNDIDWAKIPRESDKNNKVEAVVDDFNKLDYGEGLVLVADINDVEGADSEERIESSFDASVEYDKINKDNYVDFGYDEFYLGEDYDDDEGVRLLNQGKKIFVQGDVESWVGHEMKSGEITINGIVVRNVGKWMEEGTIIVTENVRGWIGYEMKDGKIIVIGNVNRLDIKGIEGGEIIVNGKLDTLEGKGMVGGTIILCKSKNPDIEEDLIEPGIIRLDENVCLD